MGARTIFDKTIYPALRELTLANVISKNTSAEFVVVNEGLLYIRSFKYLLFRILNCFCRSLRVVLHLNSPFLIGVSNGI